MKSTRYFNRFSSSVILMLTAFSVVLGNCLESYAEPVRGAVITNNNGSRTAVFQGSRRNPPRSGQPIRPNQTVLDNPNERLLVPKGRSTASLDFRYRSGRNAGFLLQAGPASTDTYYFWRCAGNGGFVIGWVRGLNNRDICKSFRLGANPNNRDRIDAGLNNNVRIGEAVTEKQIARLKSSRNSSIEAAKGLLTIADVANLQQDIFYCSAASDSGQGWGSAVSNSPWDLFSVEHPCRKAIKKCMASSPNQDCSVVNLGEWSLENLDLSVSNPQSDYLTLSMECANNKAYYKRGTITKGENLLLQMEEQAKKEGANSCQLNVYGPDEVAVAPKTSDPTLIQTDNSNGQLVINVMAGTVTVRPANEPDQPVDVSAGQRYVYGIQFDDGAAAYSGSQQAQAIPVTRNSPVQSPITAPPFSPVQNPVTTLITRSEIANLPSVKAFFDDDTSTTNANWSADIRPVIDEFRNASRTNGFITPETPQ